MLYRLLLLGQIPGTNIDFNFYEIMAVYLFGLVWLYLHRNHPTWRTKFVRFIKENVRLLTHQLQSIRLELPIGRKG